MLKRLTSLFEEDIEMQDAIEDIDSFVDDSDDIEVDVAATHYKDTGNHLFSEVKDSDAEIEELFREDDEEDSIIDEAIKKAKQEDQK